MQYDTSHLRRQERALPREEAFQLLHTAEFGTLCLQDTEGGGYGVPLNYVWDGGERIYMHCAPSGHKLNCLAQEPRVTFVVTGRMRILPEEFSTAYESVLVHGHARQVLNESEKRQALQMLIEKLTPQEAARGAQYISRAIKATCVLCLSISTICGKAHRA